MKILLPLFILIFSFSILGQITATTDDGKKVILKNDNTWQYVLVPAAPPADQASSSGSSLIDDDINQVAEFAYAHKKDLEKNEFETIDEYKQRLEIYIKSSTFNNKPLSQTAIKLNPGFNYDAERGMYKLSLPGIFLYSGRVGVALVESVDYGDGFSFLEPDFRFEMLAAKAKDVKDDLRAMIYGFPTKTIGPRTLYWSFWKFNGRNGFNQFGVRCGFAKIRSPLIFQ